MNVVDSSGWLEFFTDGPNADRFALPLKNKDALLVPAVVVYEVVKVVLRERGEHAAIQAAMAMQNGTVVEMNAGIAIEAARLSLQLSIPMADSMILATARQYEATVWTQDVDFEKIPGVKYFPKRS